MLNNKLIYHHKSMALIIVSFICSVWVILTIIGQFNWKVFQRLLSFDRFNLVPQWTFFAPNPGSTDIHLLMRFGEGQILSKWHETPLTAEYQEKFRWIRGLFNPYRRFDKMLFDFTNDVRSSKDKLSQVRHLSEYILILRFLEMLAYQYNAKTVQFMLVGSNMTLLEDIEVIILSDVHIVKPK